MWITCGCGHTDDFDVFTRTPVAGELPKGCMQCPACGRAWERRHVGEARPVRDQETGEIVGVIPPDVVVVAVASRL